MTNDKEYLIELIFNKLKNYESRKINLDKNELTKFVNYLIKNN